MICLANVFPSILLFYCVWIIALTTDLYLHVVLSLRKMATGP